MLLGVLAITSVLEALIALSRALNENWWMTIINHRSEKASRFYFVIVQTQANAEVPSKRSAIANKRLWKWKFSLQCTSVIRRGEGEIQARSDQDCAAAARMLICVVYIRKQTLFPQKTPLQNCFTLIHFVSLSIQEFEGLCTAIIRWIYLLYDLKIMSIII